MTSHTPGPWIARPNVASHGDKIAVCEQATSDILAVTWGNSAQERANARLMAAAPDLLAVCQEIANDSRVDLVDNARRIRLYAAIQNALKPNVRTP